MDICRKKNVKIPNVNQRKVSDQVDNNYNTLFFDFDNKTKIKCFVYYVVLNDLLNRLEERFSQVTLSSNTGQRILNLLTFPCFFFLYSIESRIPINVIHKFTKFVLKKIKSFFCIEV